MIHDYDIKRHAKNFNAWLVACGAEALAPTNEYEIIRFRGNKGSSIVYQNSRGKVTFTGESRAAWDAFKGAKPWRAMPPAKRKSTGNVTIKALRARDGDGCFFCCTPVSESDESVEHLVPVTSRGPSHMANYVLAHRACNSRAGNLSAMEKIRIRENHKALL